MTAWQVATICACRDQRGARFGRLNRLRHDLGRIPITSRAAEREQHKVSARQHLRTRRPLVTLHGNELLWTPTIGRHPHDAGTLPKQNLVPAPAHAKWN